MAGSLLAEAFVSIGIDTGPLKAGLAAVKGAAAGLGGVMTAALGPVALAIGGALAVKELVGSFMEAESASQGLASALGTSGQEVEGNLAHFKDLSNEIMKFTTVGDEAVLGLVKLGTNLGVPAGAMDDMVKHSIGLSRALGIDAQSAMEALAKESQGVKSSLDRSIPALKGVTDSAERLRIISELGAKGFIQEEEATGTLAGGLSQLWNAVGEVAESLGTLLAPAIKWGVDLLHKIADALGGAVEAFGGMLGPVEEFATSVGAFIEDVVFTILNFDLIVEEAGIVIAETWSMIVDRTAWLANNLEIGLMWFVDNFPQIMETGLNYGLTALTNFGENAIGFFSGLWENIGIGLTWFKDNFGKLFSTTLDFGLTALINFGQNIRNVFSSMWEWIKTKGESGFKPAIKGLFEGANSSITDMPIFKDFPKMKGLLEGAVNTITEDPKFMEFKPSLNFDDQKQQLKEEWQKRREEWDGMDESANGPDDLQKVKDGPLDKEKKGKKEGNAGSFQGLGEAFKKANEAASKSQEKRDKQKADEEAKRQRDKTNQHLEKIAKNTEDMDDGGLA